MKHQTFKLHNIEFTYSEFKQGKYSNINDYIEATLVKIAYELDKREFDLRYVYVDKDTSGIVNVYIIQENKEENILEDWFSTNLFDEVDGIKIKELPPWAQEYIDYN